MKLMQEHTCSWKVSYWKLSVLLTLSYAILETGVWLVISKHFTSNVPSSAYGKYLPGAVPSGWNGCVLNAGLWKVLAFHICKIETFRSWKSKRPLDLRTTEGCAQQSSWREANVSGSVKENLVSFIGYRIDKHEDPIAKRLCCQNKVYFNCANSRWTCCGRPQLILLISFSGVELLRGTCQVVSTCLLQGWVNCCQGSASCCQWKGVGKKRKSSWHVVSMVLRRVAGEQWKGLGQKEMTLYIDLIWLTLETNHVPKRQVPRCVHSGLICRSEKWIISKNLNVYQYKPFNRMRWSPLDRIVGLHHGWSSAIFYNKYLVASMKLMNTCKPTSA